MGSTGERGHGSLTPTPLPRLELFCMYTVQIAEALNVELAFPFLAFMVEDFGYSGKQLGIHAGILASTFCAAQFTTAVPWGIFSDRYGRKPALVGGLLGAAAGMAAFGLSKNMLQAATARAVGGMLCGNLGVMKSHMTEITDNSNRANAFYLLNLSCGPFLRVLSGSSTPFSSPA
ncbi:major facilitator superfamily domain-containing protein [Ochromonadaceae sp. CCMP2298]|nr:major facilitator superfamily domain-containing protein [Ochromonadaceae sp. CCMP2298]